jgi:hypothetical protein
VVVFRELARLMVALIAVQSLAGTPSVAASGRRRGHLRVKGVPVGGQPAKYYSLDIEESRWWRRNPILARLLSSPIRHPGEE